MGKTHRLATIHRLDRLQTDDKQTDGNGHNTVA